jgi:D-amino-acid dehydrogenase
LLLLSRQLWGELIEREQLQCEFAADGTLHVHRDAGQLERAQRDTRLLAELGVTVHVLDAAAARAMEPALNDSIVGGQFFPDDASLRPERCLLELARIVRAAGGEIREHTAVRGFRTEGASVSAVQTSQGELRGAEFVLALGAWLPALTRELGLRLPIEPAKGYSITYDGAATPPRRVLFLKECAVCLTPWQSGLRLGSTLEFAGYDSSLNPARLGALVRGAHRYLRFAPSARIQEQWFGWRPMTPDDLPILGRAPGWRNVSLATGHGMLGVSLAPVSALAIRELLAGREPPFDLEPFSPARFRH